MTYSIVAVDPDAGHMGVAVQSHYFGVGALVPWTQPGLGVVATQSVVRAEYGPELMDYLARGVPPQVALNQCVSRDPGSALRQVAVMAADGSSAGYTGVNCIGAAGQAVGDGVRAQANLVTGPAVWQDMVDAFTASRGDLATRMLDALDAAQAAGGDLRGQQAAAMRIVRTTDSGDLAADTVLDIRVDDAGEPLRELRRLARASTGLAGLVGLLETPGLLSGPLSASAERIEGALRELAAAQEILGVANAEPTVWRGVLLARAGRAAEASAAFQYAAATMPALIPLLESLAAAGMWLGPPSELTALVPPSR